MHSGNNVLYFSHLSSILEPYAINRRIVGFDTFDGFRSLNNKDPEDISEKDFGNVSLDAIKNAITLYNMNRTVGHMKRVEVIQGDATETIDTL